MGVMLKKIVVSLVLVLLGGFLLWYGWQERRIKLRLFEPTMEAARHLSRFPEAQYKIGYELWFKNRLPEAAALLRRAVTGDVFYMDAWVKLGEVEAAQGNLPEAGAILDYVDRLTGDVYRWKWSQAMMALKLGAQDVFLRNINGLIPVDQNRQSALFVLDNQFNGNVREVLPLLDADNLAHYLDWLMRTRRVEDARMVWAAMDKAQQEDPQRRIRYIHFLLGNKQVAAAKQVWQQEGISNPGFEQEFANRGFGWRAINPKHGHWKIKRALVPEVRSDFTAQVWFAGKENVNFYHLYQIVPVEPGKSYRLSYEWRSMNITTDQGPFVEVYGFQCKGLHKKGPMMRGTEMWRTETIAFEVPEGCEAVVVRLRRVPSRRFDSKIEGRVWLDNFGLVEVEGNSS